MQLIMGFLFLFLDSQAHAASAVLNFSENCTPEILTPYLDGIVSKLLVLLQVIHTRLYGVVSFTTGQMTFMLSFALCYCPKCRTENKWCKKEH